jgi:hypothetical protein
MGERVNITFLRRVGGHYHYIFQWFLVILGGYYCRYPTGIIELINQKNKNKNIKHVFMLW